MTNLIIPPNGHYLAAPKGQLLEVPLSIIEGLTPVYSIGGNTAPWKWGAIPTGSADPTWDAVTADFSADGYRLPTEMEWLWAAMGAASDARSGDIAGGVNTGGFSKGYAGSTEAGSAQVNIDSYALTAAFSPVPTTTTNTGLLLANELGLYDMTGNVFQLCWDWYDTYSSKAITDPGYTSNLASGEYRVISGGCFEQPESCAALLYSLSCFPYFPSNEIGFRVVRP